MGVYVKDPLVSVIIPVHNAEKYIRDSILSILEQTYKNIELVIIDDASTDNSLNIINEINDDRIIVIKNETNLKQSMTRNKGLALAKGKYIANMDADDVCKKNRILKQVEFMERNTDIDVCGAFLRAFGNGKNYIMRFPTDKHDLMVRSIYATPFGHPTVMIRKSSIEKYNIKYDKNYTYSQDFELWSRIAFNGAKFANIPEELFLYRVSNNQISARYFSEQQIFKGKIIERNINFISKKRITLSTLTNNCFSVHEVKKDINDICNCEMGNNMLLTNSDVADIKRKIIFIILNRSSFLGVKIFPLFCHNLKYDIYKKEVLKLLLKIIFRYNPARLNEKSS